MKLAITYSVLAACMGIVASFGVTIGTTQRPRQVASQTALAQPKQGIRGVMEINGYTGSMYSPNKDKKLLNGGTQLYVTTDDGGSEIKTFHVTKVDNVQVFGNVRTEQYLRFTFEDLVKV